ncbi:hypothetical protein E2C01_032877 [Portunus trituberculatus]|uniref:Uncharacterized protein n=1 Tax=Portunus trituberculatus TaxID=210409 RepID=A0A5B7F2N2_PORTR|nr:hypothetical protein [Portunus trituberculatus]
MKYLELPLILPQIPADAIKAHIQTELRSWPRRVKRREGIQKAVSVPLGVYHIINAYVVNTYPRLS